MRIKTLFGRCGRLAAGGLLILEVAALGQVGPYPGGQYPGSGSQLPFPWPRRGGGASPGRDREILMQAKGRLLRIDSKGISVEVADGRSIEFDRNSKTKFLQGSASIDPSSLKAGDQVAVEASEDNAGRLTARTVRLEKAAEPAEPARPPANVERRTGPQEYPDRPVLRRGVPDRPRREAAEHAEATPAEPAPAPPDPLLEKARLSALDFTSGLPNYVCKEFMTRFASDSRPPDWKAIDVVSAELVYEDGAERYAAVAVNGRATRKEISELDGSWSTGEFGTILRDLLSHGTAAEFRLRGESTTSGSRARVYDFKVERQRSHWHIKTASQSIRPAYKGSVWIEPQGGRVLRIEMQARELPGEFPLDIVETAVDYERIRIGAREFLLPTHAESLACRRGSADCTRNAIDFRNYRRFDSSSNVTFESAEK